MKRKALSFLLVFVLLFSFGLLKATSLPGAVELQYQETDTPGVFKIVIFAAADVGVRDLDVIFSYDNQIVNPIDTFDNSLVTIINEDTNSYPIVVTAKDTRNNLYTLTTPLWLIHNTRTSLRVGVYITNTTNVTQSFSSKSMFEVYFTFVNGKSISDFVKGTFKIESAWGTSESDSFLMDYFNLPNNTLASTVGDDVAPLAIKQVNQTWLYGFQANGTISQINLTYTYPNSTVATLGSITLGTAGSVTSIDIPANTTPTPNTLQIEAQTFDTDGDPYTLLPPGGTWTLTSAPENVSLIPSLTDNLLADLLVPANVQPGTARVTFSSGTISKFMDITIQRSASIPTRAEYYKNSVMLSPGVTDYLNIPNSGSPNLVQAYQVKVYDQYDIQMIAPTIDWSQSGGTNITHTVDGSDGTIVNANVANGALPGAYVLKAKIGSFEAVQPIKSTRSLETFSTITVATIPNQTYTGQHLVPALDIDDGAIQLIKDTDYTVVYSSNINTGTANVAIAGIGNYSGTLAHTFTIQQAVLTATVEDASKIYGQTNPTFPVTVAGFVNGETALTAAGYVAPTASCPATSITRAGSAITIPISGGSATNYTFDTTDTGTLTVTPALLTATVENATKTYGQTNPVFPVTVMGFVNGEDATTADGYVAPTAASVATTSTPVGDVAITINGGSATNYTFNTSGTATLTISKAVLTATVEDATRAYGQANPNFPVTVIGFVNSETAVSADGYVAPTANTDAVTGTNVGTPKISITGGSATNYSFNLEDAGILTITPAMLTATVEDATKVYGQTNPSFPVTVAGFVNGETAETAALYVAPLATSLATNTTGIGTASITISGGSATNYLFNILDTGTLNITPALLTATVENAAKTYGQTNPVFPVTVTGFVNGENATTAAGYVAPTAASVATPTTPVSDVAITISGGSATNYTFNIADTATLTINKAVLTATVEDATRPYGQANPNFPVAVTGFVNSETSETATAYVAPTASSVAVLGTNVGSSPITITGGSATNYSFNLADTGALTITPVVLTVSVGDASKVYGETNPTFPVTVEGFVNSETAATATGYVAPTASSLAANNTGIGTAIITISGGAATNYTFNISDTGTLNIAPALLTATVENATKTYGQVNPVFPVTVTGFVNGENATTAAGYVAPTAASVATTSTPVSDIAITISGGSADNYTLNIVDQGILTIGKAVLTATVEDATRAYGQANPNFPVTVTGFVNSETAITATGYVAPTASSVAVPTSNVGSSPITITGGSATNYSFVISDTAVLTIQMKLLSDADVIISPISDQPYTGSSIVPTPTLANSSLLIALVEENDYFVSGYSANVEVGTVTITLQGSGNYNGIATTTFNIVKSAYPGTLAYTVSVVSNTAAANKLYDLGIQVSVLPGFNEMTYGSPVNSGALFAATSTVAIDGKITYHVTSQVAGVQGTITIPVTSKNYTDTNAVVTVRVTDVNPVWTQVDSLISGTVYTYGDANSKTSLPASGTATAGQAALVGTFTYKNPTTIQHNGSRVITVVFTVTTAGEYQNVEVEKDYTVIIQPKPITVVAVNKTRDYGEVNPALTYTFNAANLVTGDSQATLDAGLNLTCAATTTTDVGSVNITGSDSNASDDYQITVTTGSLTIQKATIAAITTNPPVYLVFANAAENTSLANLLPLVTASTVQVQYGLGHTATLPINWAFVPSTSFNIKGSVYTLDGTVGVGTNFNTYTGVHQATLTVQPVTGTLTSVVPSSVTIARVTQTSATTHADFELPATISFTFDQGQGSNTYTAPQWDTTVSALKAMPVETSTLVTLVQSSAVNNVPLWLTISPISVNVNVIEKLPILTADITITNATITYGDVFVPTSSIANGSSYNNPVVAYSFKDAQNLLLAEQPTNAGVYTMIATYESDTHKGMNQATLTINPKPVTVVIEDKTRVYGVANPALTWKFDTGFSMIAGETNDDLLVTLISTAIMTTPVGTDVDITGASTNTNYVVTFQGETVGTTGKLTITKSPLSALVPTITTIPSVTPVPVGYELIAALLNVADAELTWQWYQAGAAIIGATSKTYTLVNADSNQLITVEAIAKEINYTWASQRSIATQVVKVTATGSAAVLLKTDLDSDGISETGDVLSVSVMISPVEALTSTQTYQWKRNNVDITSATSVDYTLTADDAGKNISVVVTLTGDFSGMFTSATIEVGKIVLTGTVSLTNSGAAVGDTITATAAGVPGILDTDYSIVWLRNGQVVTGTSGATYTITTADLGKAIDAKLVAKGTTYSGEVVSTGAVTIPAVAPSTPSVSGYVGDKTIAVNWTEPANGGSPITHYIIQKDSDDPIVVVYPTRNYNFTALTNGTKYTITVIAVNVIGVSPAGTADFTPQPPADEPYVPPTPPKPPTNTVPVVVNGVDKPVATTETTEATDGTTQTTITTNEDLTTAMEETSTLGTTVSLTFTEPATTYTSVLAGNTVQAMEDKEAVLEIKTETATYTIPAVQMNIQSVSEQMGTDVPLTDIKISVTISEPPANTVQVIADTANTNNYILVVQPVQFQVTASYEEQTVEISKFTGYVERTIAIPDGVDPSKITTAVVLNDDGTFSHVPTTIVMINGKYFAKISSLTNSTYTVIYNQVTFADIQGHWAQEAIIDMGSRLIVSGTGNDNYEPDREITRAEFAAIVVRALGLRAGSGVSQFPDVTINSWYAGSIQTAVEYGLIFGYETGNFGPNDPITREQAMTIIARAMIQTNLNTIFTAQQIATTLGAFADATDIADYAKVAVTACIQHGIVSGRTATTIAPQAFISRAEVAVIVRRLLETSNLI
jgi:hypothetical protein